VKQGAHAVGADGQRRPKRLRLGGAAHRMADHALDGPRPLDGACHSPPLAHGNPRRGPGLLQQQVVQLVAADNHTVGRCVPQATRSAWRKVGLGPDPGPAAKAQPPGAKSPLLQDGGQHTQLLKDGYSLGHDPLATGFVAGKGRPVQQQHPAARPTQQDGTGRASHAGTDDDHVIVPARKT